MTKQIDENLIEIDAIASNILNDLIVLPIADNYAVEKAKFFETANYNPVFTYRPVASDIPDRIAKLDSALSSTNLTIYNAYFSRLFSYLQEMYQLSLCLGTDQYGDAEHPSYNWKLPELKEFSSLPKVEMVVDTSPLVAPAETVSFFNTILQSYGIDDWQAFLYTGSRNQLISVLPGVNKVKVGANAFRTQKTLDRLARHEIETHVLRTINGRKQPLQLFSSIGLPDYILYEEGLAVFNEVNTGLIDAATWQVYVTRYEGCLMLGYSFNEIYTFYRETFDQDKSFDMAYRVKRGLGDTSQSGGCIKDAAYLLGYKLVGEFIASGHSLVDLYMGKISPNELIFKQGSLLSNKDLILPKWLTQAL